MTRRRISIETAYFMGIFIVFNIFLIHQVEGLGTKIGITLLMITVLVGAALLSLLENE